MKPASATTDQKAIINSLSSLLAFFKARQIAMHPMTKQTLDMVPNTMSSKLSDIAYKDIKIRMPKQKPERCPD